MYFSNKHFTSFSVCGLFAKIPFTKKARAKTLLLATSPWWSSGDDLVLSLPQSGFDSCSGRSHFKPPPSMASPHQLRAWGTPLTSSTLSPCWPSLPVSLDILPVLHIRPYVSVSCPLTAASEPVLPAVSHPQSLFSALWAGTVCLPSCLSHLPSCCINICGIYI